MLPVTTDAQLRKLKRRVKPQSLQNYNVDALERELVKMGDAEVLYMLNTLKHEVYHGMPVARSAFALLHNIVVNLAYVVPDVPETSTKL